MSPHGNKAKMPLRLMVSVRLINSASVTCHLLAWSSLFWRRLPEAGRLCFDGVCPRPGRNWRTRVQLGADRITAQWRPSEAAETVLTPSTESLLRPCWVLIPCWVPSEALLNPIWGPPEPLLSPIWGPVEPLPSWCCVSAVSPMGPCLESKVLKVRSELKPC